MTTAAAILEELRPLGQEGTRRVLRNHGAQESCLGVKVEELKKIQKRVKKDYRLALELYETGVYEAMYLAGLIADDGQMTPADLQRWAEQASAPLAGSTVAWVAAGSAHGRELALEWIDSKNDFVALAGWSTLGCLVAIKPDTELDLAELTALLQRVERTIHQAPNAVRSSMNHFVIAVGAYVRDLTEFALQLGADIGPVTVDVGNTACKVPFAPDYIRKIEQRGTIGKKRKTVKC